jgi:hypothetical protein
LPAPQAPSAPNGYTVAQNANGSYTVTGPQGGTYQTTGYYDANGYPIYKSSSGNYVTLENGNTLVPSPSAANGNSTIAQNNTNGIQFQTAVQKTLQAGGQNTTPVTEIVNGVPVTTIPDGLTSTTVTEIKSDAYLTSSPQLSAQMQFATNNGRSYSLIISPNTIVSGPLEKTIQNLPNGGSIQIYNPTTGQLTPYLGTP